MTPNDPQMLVLGRGGKSLKQKYLHVMSPIMYSNSGIGVKCISPKKEMIAGEMGLLFH